MTDIMTDAINYIKGKIYTIIFKHNIPSWNMFQIMDIQEAYPKINVLMEVYCSKQKILLYSVELNIDGHYYCCGSCNFEYDRVDKNTIKNIENIDLINGFMIEHQDKIKNYLNNTVMDIWKTRVFDYLCDY